jgi:hypothetical protein
LFKGTMNTAKRLQPRSEGGSYLPSYLPSAGFHEDWIAHIDSELEEDEEQDPEDEDGIFEMDDL